MIDFYCLTFVVFVVIVVDAIFCGCCCCCFFVLFNLLILCTQSKQLQKFLFFILSFCSNKLQRRPSELVELVSIDFCFGNR